jgi:hypothetical protein
VVFPTTEFTNSTSATDVLLKLESSRLSSNFGLTTTSKSATQHSRLLVSFPTPPSVTKPVLKAMLCEFTPSRTTFFERTSKPLAQVLTVFLKACDALSARTSEPLPV